MLVQEAGLALREEVPRDKRVLFRKLAKFLVRNEFEHVSQLLNGMSHCTRAVALLNGIGLRRRFGTESMDRRRCLSAE